MSSRPDRPAIASLSANGSSHEYVRVRSAAMRRTLSADRVALHAAWVGACAHEPVGLTGDGGHAPGRPRGPDRDVVATALEVADGPGVEARLERERPRSKPSWEERRDQVIGMELRRVDGRLEIQAQVDVPDERVQRPLLLLVATGGPPGEVG